ncbi:hypothetical protein POVCU2_0023020, partial [Plasmodium ovale curtisi]
MPSGANVGEHAKLSGIMLSCDYVRMGKKEKIMRHESTTPNLAICDAMHMNILFAEYSKSAHFANCHNLQFPFYNKSETLKNRSSV